MTKTRKTALALACALGSAFFASHAIAADHTLRFSHWVPATHVVHTALSAWGTAVEEATGGKVKVEMYPSQQLGSAKDHYEMVSSGIVEGAWMVPGYSPGRFPIVSAGELPFLVTEGKGASIGFDEWYRPHAQKEMSETYYCFSIMQEPGVLHSKQPIKSLEEFDGMKLRVATGTLGSYLGEVGASPVSIPAPDVRHAAETGVIDGLTYGWKTSQVLGVSAVLKAHMDLPFYSVPTQVLLSKGFLDGLPEDVSNAVKSTCNSEMAGKLGEIWGQWEASGQPDIAAEEGAIVYTPSAELIDAMRKAANATEAAWISSVVEAGVDGEAEMKALEAAFAKQRVLLK